MRKLLTTIFLCCGIIACGDGGIFAPPLPTQTSNTVSCESIGSCPKPERFDVNNYTPLVTGDLDGLWVFIINDFDKSFVADSLDANDNVDGEYRFSSPQKLLAWLNVTDNTDSISFYTKNFDLNPGIILPSSASNDGNLTFDKQVLGNGDIQYTLTDNYGSSSSITYTFNMMSTSRMSGTIVNTALFNSSYNFEMVKVNSQKTSFGTLSATSRTDQSINTLIDIVGPYSLKRFDNASGVETTIFDDPNARSIELGNNAESFSFSFSNGDIISPSPVIKYRRDNVFTFEGNFFRGVSLNYSELNNSTGLLDSIYNTNTEIFGGLMSATIDFTALALSYSNASVSTASSVNYTVTFSATTE